jgi:peptidoglycan/xylan/chitin deacetylase (PgdA/CDA1 family)
MLKKFLKELVFFFINFFLKQEENRASILMYHSIGEERAFFSVNPVSFEKQIKYIKDKGYKVVKISELLSKVRNHSDISNLVSITFDDGYKNNFSNAFFVFKKYNIPASIFLATDFIGKSMSSSDSFNLDILNMDEIKEMKDSGLIEFLPHSMSHRTLNSINLNEAIDEIEGSFKILKSINSNCPKIFAFPKGKFTKEVVDYLRKENWLGAVSVVEGNVSINDDLLTLRRNSVDRETSFNQFKAKVSGKVSYYVRLKNFLFGNRENVIK